MNKTITVKGVGKTTAKPDYIILTLSIFSQDMDYDTAMECSAQKIAVLETTAGQLGFEKGALKTVSFNVSTQYESQKDSSGNFQNVFAGYNCSYRLKLAFDFDHKRLACVLSTMASSGANPELNISFTVKAPAKVNEKLLSSAAINAKEKAEILCCASGVALGQLLSIDYSWEELNLLSRTQYNMSDGAMPLMAAKTRCAPEITPDDIDLRDTATFVWEIK